MSLLTDIVLSFILSFFIWKKNILVDIPFPACTSSSNFIISSAHVTKMFVFLVASDVAQSRTMYEMVRQLANYWRGLAGSGISSDTTNIDLWPFYGNCLFFNYWRGKVLNYSGIKNQVQVSRSKCLFYFCPELYKYLALFKLSRLNTIAFLSVTLTLSWRRSLS